MISKCFCLPQRYVFAIMGFYVTCASYMMRVTVEVAFPSMVQTSDTTTELYDGETCPNLMALPNLRENTTIDHFDSKFLDWNEQSINSLNAAYKFSYPLINLLGGMVAQRSGGKKMLGGCLSVFSFCTLISPVASKLIGLTALTILRFISGLVSGIIVPALIAMMSKWAPRDEQAFISSIIFPGYVVGFAVGSWLGELLVSKLGWESVFYTYGSFGVLCCGLWTWLVYSTPNEHPRITESEKIYLNKDLIALVRSEKYNLDPLPLFTILRYGALWGTAMGFASREWALETLRTLVPRFMRDVMRYDITATPAIQYVPYLCMWLAALPLGWICDMIIRRGFCSVKNARRIFNAVGTFGAALCIVIITYSNCNSIVAIFWMFTGIIFVGSFYSGCVVSALDMSPNYAGATGALAYSVGINMGIALPNISSAIVSKALFWQWQISLWVVVIVLFATYALYFYYVPNEQLWWDDVRQFGYPENWTSDLFLCEGRIDKNGKSIYKEKQDVEYEESGISESQNEL